MTRDEFLSKWGDHVNGLLLASLAEAQVNVHFGDDKAMGVRGRFMLAQMRRAREMLMAMFEDLVPSAAPPARHPAPVGAPAARAPANGTNSQPKRG